MENYTVFIPTSGIGTALGGITKFTNKSLIKVGKKPTLSYILENYPKNTDFVISIGHFGNQIKEFIHLVYPDRSVSFVDVDCFEGQGSSLAYSMLKAEKFLQRPFIYHASDTIINEKVEMPSEKNWIAGFKSEGSSHYASFDSVDGIVRHLYDKGTLNPDFLHIGVVGIKDYQKFWSCLNELYAQYPKNESLGDIHALKKMLDAEIEFQVKPVKRWYDVGNVDSLNKVRQEIPDSFHILDKMDESIYIFDEFVVKFFAKESMVAKRVARAKVLKNLVPEIEGHGKNFYRYKFIQGDLFSDVANPKIFDQFLHWSKEYLWKPITEVDPDEFKKICLNFYQQKTLERIEKFLESRSIADQATIINEETTPPIKELIHRIDFDWLTNTTQSMFHGDFILDNIIKTKEGYCLLDWRQDFGGLLHGGDLYYDLAKLNHNLTVNHGIVNDNLFTINVHHDRVDCDILRKENLIRCQEVFFKFLNEGGYDLKKVQILTALIWLNMSPLHHHPFDLFLFYFGKLNLCRALLSYDSKSKETN